MSTSNTRTHVHTHTHSLSLSKQALDELTGCTLDDGAGWFYGRLVRFNGGVKMCQFQPMSKRRMGKKSLVTSWILRKVYSTDPSKHTPTQHAHA